MAKYGEKASQKVEKAMHELKQGTLKIGRSGKNVKSRKQAIAIGLAQARRTGWQGAAKETIVDAARRLFQQGARCGILDRLRHEPGRRYAGR